MESELKTPLTSQEDEAMTAEINLLDLEDPVFDAPNWLELAPSFSISPSTPQKEEVESLGTMAVQSRKRRGLLLRWMCLAMLSLIVHDDDTKGGLNNTQETAFLDPERAGSVPPEVKETVPPSLSVAAKIEKYQKQLFSGEFAWENFPADYRELIAEKIARFGGECELDQACIRDQIESALKRAGPYFAAVKKMVAEAELPPIFAYLAFTESLWQPHALSHAGAYGVVQFMPRTAEWIGFKLSGDYAYWFEKERRIYKGKDAQGKPLWEEVVSVEKQGESTSLYLYDERRDVFAAHEKKIEYLRRLATNYDHLPHILAAFAYNYGPGNVNRLLGGVDYLWQELPSAEKTPARYLALFLDKNANKESYNYVANLMAFTAVISALEIRNPQWVQPMEVERGKLDISASLPNLITPETVRKALRMGMEFYDWNQGIHDPRRKIAAIDHYYKFVYQVEKGESFASLALKFADRGISGEDLRAAAAGDELKVGEWLTLRGRFVREDDTGRQTGAACSSAEAERMESQFPPLPAGWTINFPPEKKALWKEFLRVEELESSD